MNRGRSVRIFLVLAAGCCMLSAPRTGSGDDWLPVSQEELKMTSEPLAPGAPAIYLYRQVDRDDQGSHETNYARIKILTEEGRKHANIELPFIKGRNSIHSIKARTIRPDGIITNAGAQPGDVLILTKPAGTGIFRLVISARSQPLPPRRLRSWLLPSAFPAPKK